MEEEKKEEVEETAAELNEEGYSEEEQKEIEERLKSLGYIG